MNTPCPECGRAVPDASVNVVTDLGQCPSCKAVFRLSGALGSGDASLAKEVLNNPPKGTWRRTDIEGDVVGATTRSPMAFFLVPFMCVWSGGSLGGIYGSQIVSGKFSLLPSLFGIPFLLGSILFWSLAMMTIFGKVEVTLGRGEARIFTGVGRVGWTRRVDWSSVRSVVEVPGHKNTTYLALEGATRVQFGSMLNANRRYFMLNALRANLRRKL